VLRSISRDCLFHSHVAYGQGYGFTGSIVTKYGYTGEPTNENGLVYLRARHYHPTFGVFPSLDPLEGEPSQPLPLNRYMWLLGCC
jgi:RHS repeat-associated protein